MEMESHKEMEWVQYTCTQTSVNSLAAPRMLRVS